MTNSLAAPNSDPANNDSSFFGSQQMTVAVGAAAGGLVAVIAIIVLIVVCRKKPESDAHDRGAEETEFSLVPEEDTPQYGTVVEGDFINPITVAHEPGAASVDANLNDDDDDY
jgi:hypothetical protein